MGLGSTIYNTLFKKTSTMLLVMCGGALVFDTITDYAAEYIFNKVNEGKLWHHIKDNYAKD